MYTRKPLNETRIPQLPLIEQFTPLQLRAYRAGQAESRTDGLVFNRNNELGGITGKGAEPAPVVPTVYADVADYFAGGWYETQNAMADEQAAELRRREPAPADPSTTGPNVPSVNVTVTPAAPAAPAPADNSSGSSWFWYGGLLAAGFAGGWFVRGRRLRRKELGARSEPR